MTPPLVLRKIFENPKRKKSHVVYQGTGTKVAQLKFYDKASFSYILVV